MNKYQLINLGAAVLLILAGCVYLVFGSATVPAVLAASVILLCVMGGSGIAQARSLGQKGFAAFLPSLCFFVLSGFIVAALVYYYFI